MKKVARFSELGPKLGILLCGALLCTLAQAVEFEIERRTLGADSGRFNFGMGGEALIPLSSGTATYYAPLAELQFSVTQFIAVGLQGAYLNATVGTTDYTGYGLLASVHFYPEGVYGGLWVHAAGGIFSVTASRTTSSPTVLGAVGWRWHANDFQGSSGICLGPQAVFASGSTNLGIMARLDFALDFYPSDLFF